MEREPLRLGASAVLAAVVHVALALLVLSLEEKPLFEPAARVAVELIERVPSPPAPEPEAFEPEASESEPLPPEPEAPPAPPPPPKPRPEPKAEPTPEPPPVEPPPAPVDPSPPSEPAPAPSSDAPVDAPAGAPAPPAPALPSGSDSSVRVKPREPSFMDRVLGTGNDPFGTTLKDLEGGLEYKAEGPMSDGERAQKMARRIIEDELADDAVSAGLVDDYFRALRTRVETAWQPAKKQLNDGGQAATQVGMLSDLGQNPQAIGEMWETYLDIARQYARGEKPTIDKRRAERLRELFRSRKGNFRVHAVTEVVVTQAADGQILTIEIPTSSGHPAFDEGVRDAFVAAARAMVEKPPHRLSNGRAFRSTWRMRATWIMVPPTAWLSGAGWDISPKGVTIDVPFDIKLRTRVMLVGFDNRDHSIRERR